MSLQLQTIAALTSGAGFLMVASGLHKGLLRRSKAGRFCPSCGRELAGRVCAYCNGGPH
jgi:hypothetical protein